MLSKCKIYKKQKPKHFPILGPSKIMSQYLSFHFAMFCVCSAGNRTFTNVFKLSTITGL